VFRNCEEAWGEDASLWCVGRSPPQGAVQTRPQGVGEDVSLWRVGRSPPTVGSELQGVGEDVPTADALQGVAGSELQGAGEDMSLWCVGRSPPTRRKALLAQNYKALVPSPLKTTLFDEMRLGSGRGAVWEKTCPESPPTHAGLLNLLTRCRLGALPPKTYPFRRNEVRVGARGGVGKALATAGTSCGHVNS
jgi:hypothetical protein